ncbi:MAG: ribonuclease H family protein, partial [Verrucomicrobiota bacterium]|nr:ribonuclease H family protein [Verrucomicrobiota bacterium]
MVNIGHKTVTFFGYEVTKDGYQLGRDREEVLQSIPMPTTVKEMQSFLGVTVFFAKFVPSYATVVAPLYEATKAKFNWKDEYSCAQLERHFAAAKEAILKHTKLYFPDYSLRWVLRTDASQYGVGSVLLQMKIDDQGEEIPQPIAFTSQKFSEAATRWSTIHQECFAMFAAVRRLSYYLRGKFFELETDHANLQWLERSENPAIVRMRIYLQEFVTKIRHISGSSNRVADYMSRVRLRDNASVNLCYLLHMEGIRQLHLGIKDDYKDGAFVEETYDTYLSLITTAGQLHCENLPLVAPMTTRSSTHAGGEEKEVVEPMDIDA